MSLFSTLGDLLIPSPFFALVPAAGFLLAWRATHSRLALGSAALWSLYAIYEQMMKSRVLCSGECNIRIDLIVIYPALLVASAVALIAVVARASRPRS